MSAGYWSLVEPVLESINIYDGPATFLETFADAGEPAGLLFAAHWCNHEVCNGGFGQFFSNSTGVLAPEAIRGFRAIGQTEIAAVVERAVAQFGPIYPRERDLRNAALLDLPDAAFDDLDNRFYELVESEAGGFEAAANAFAEQTPR